MKKIALALSFLLLAACPALAQVNPWFQNGASLSPYDPTVGITVPSTVTGGNKGPGTGNFSNLYINGTPVQGFGNEPRNTVLAGPLSGADAQPTFRGLTSADLPSGTGTVTSVGLVLPNIFNLSGSPVTTSGMITATLANQNANLFFAGPSSGSATTPSFRAIVNGDLPGSGALTVNGVSIALGAGGTITAAATSIVPGTTTIPSGGTPNGLLYDAAGTLGNLATAANGVLITNGSQVPSISSTLPSGIAATNMALTTPNIGAATGQSVALTTTSSTLNQAINTSQTAAGTVSVNTNLNTILINDNVNAGTGTGTITGFIIAHYFGGSSTSGGRQALAVYAINQAAVNTGSTLQQYVAVAASCWLQVGGAGQSPSCFGINPYARAYSGVTSANLTGGEINVDAQTGANIIYKSGIQIVQEGTETVRGSSYDAAIMISNKTGSGPAGQGGGAGWLNVLQANDTANGSWALASTATFIGISCTNGSVACSLAKGIDFSQGTFSGNPWTSPGAALNNAGVWTAGVWQGTKIALAYGGTSADLSATGGTSQVLKQTSPGGTVTVAQLAASDLSDGTSGTGSIVLVTSAAMNQPSITLPTLVGSGGFWATVNRANNTTDSLFILHTNGTNDWAVGERGTSDSDWHFFSYGPTADVMTLQRAGGMTLNYALTYGGVTLGNSFTGSSGSSMVGSISPTFTGTVGAATIAATATIKTGLYTVSSGTGNPALPSASSVGAGARAYVTDAVACTFLASLTGGGTTGCPVVSNGTSWQGG